MNPKRGMLVLIRGYGESITIGGNVTVVMLGHVAGGKTKLGIIAPPEVPVDRTEIHRRKMQKAQDDARSSGAA